MSKDAPAHKDRLAAVADAIKRRMGGRGFSAAMVVRRSGLSENTFHSILGGKKRHNTSAYVAIAAALEWPYDYLVNILYGESEKNVAESPLEAHLAAVGRRLDKMDTLQEDVAGIKGVVHEIDQKLDVLIGPLREA